MHFRDDTWRGAARASRSPSTHRSFHSTTSFDEHVLWITAIAAPFSRPSDSIAPCLFMKQVDIIVLQHARHYIQDIRRSSQDLKIGTGIPSYKGGGDSSPHPPRESQTTPVGPSETVRSTSTPSSALSACVRGREWLTEGQRGREAVRESRAWQK